MPTNPCHETLERDKKAKARTRNQPQRTKPPWPLNPHGLQDRETSTPSMPNSSEPNPPYAITPMDPNAQAQKPPSEQGPA